MSIEFFVSTDDEIAEISDLDKLLDLIFRYNINANGANNFQDVNTIFEFFIQNVDYVPKQVIKTLNTQNYSYKIYKLDKHFIEAVSIFERAKLNDSDASEYWKSRNYFSQAIWNAFYGLHNLCIYAVRDKRNIYLLEESND